MIDIDEGYGHQQGTEIHISQGEYAQIEAKEYEKEQHACEKFHQWIAGRDPLPAIGAAGSEKKITEDRDVLPGSDAMITVGTMRGRIDDGFFPGKPVDDHIQKAANNEPEEENEEI